MKTIRNITLAISLLAGMSAFNVSAMYRDMATIQREANEFLAPAKLTSVAIPVTLAPAGETLIQKLGSNIFAGAKVACAATKDAAISAASFAKDIGINLAAKTGRQMLKEAVVLTEGLSQTPLFTTCVLGGIGIATYKVLSARCFRLSNTVKIGISAAVPTALVGLAYVLSHK